MALKTNLQIIKDLMDRGPLAQAFIMQAIANATENPPLCPVLIDPNAWEETAELLWQDLKAAYQDQ